MLRRFRRILLFPFKITILTLAFEILIFLFMLLSGYINYILYITFGLILSLPLIIEITRYAGYSTKDIINGLKKMNISKLGKYELITSLIHLAAISLIATIITLLPLPDFIFNCILLSAYIFTLSLYKQKTMKSYAFGSAKPLEATMARLGFLIPFFILALLLAAYWYFFIIFLLIQYGTFPIDFFISMYPLLIVGSIPTLYIVKTLIQILFPRSKLEEAPTKLKEIINELSERTAIKNVRVMLTSGSPNMIFSLSTEEYNLLVFSNLSLKFFSKEELEAIALHELVHLKFDGLARFYECLRPRFLKLLAISWFQLFVLLPIIFTFIGKYSLPASTTIISSIVSAGIYFLIVAVSLMMSYLALTSTGVPLELREARADFISALSHHKSLKSALLKLSRSRKFDFGTFSELYFFLPRRDKKKAVRLSDITPKSLYLIIPQRNAHPPLSQRLLIIDLAGKIASDGLDVKFLRPLSEKEFAFLPNSEKLLKAAETFREKGKIMLEDSLEHGLSPSDLFGLIVFMEKRGIISIPYEMGRISSSPR